MIRRRRFIRHDIGAAIAEARLLRVKTYRCPRCNEEITGSTIWCPHCGFDMTDPGGLYRQSRRRKEWVNAFDGARVHLGRGMVAAVVIFVVFLVLSADNSWYGLDYAGYTLALAVWILGVDLSVRGLMYTGPTLVSLLAVVSTVR